jgi:hypothetical protein
MRYNIKLNWGYSTDVKPITSQIGDRFLEIDTQLEYVFLDYNQWSLIGSNTNTFSGGTVSGATNFTNGLSANTISATTYYNLPQDIYVTGGTYSSGTAIFTNNTGGTFNVTGFKTNDVFVTGGTYSNNTFTYTNNTGGTFSVLFNTVTGLTINGDLTVTGNTSLQSLSARTISATTYYNIPIKYYAEYSGSPTTSPIVLSTNSIAIGDGAQANSSSMFVVGLNVGYQSTGVTGSNFIGSGAGQQASNSSNSNFFGVNSGYQASNSNNSNFIGRQSGYQSTGTTYSNFIGYSAGQQASNSNYSNFFGQNSGYQATSSIYSNFIGIQSGYQSTGVTSSNFIGFNAGYVASNSSYSNFFGYQSGYQASNSTFSNFIGQNSGYQASNSTFSNFIGQNSGYQSTGVTVSNFIGQNAGQQSTNSTYLNFIGSGAGQQASNLNYSNFFGVNSGYQASNSNDSNFIGRQSGYQSTGTTNSNFFGYKSGQQATNSTYSNFFGFQSGSGMTGTNNIIIGTNISLPNNTNNSINIGGVLFGINTYSNTTGNPFTGATSTGKIGINVVTPSEALHVSGNTLVQGSLTANTISATTYQNIPIKYYAEYSGTPTSSPIVTSVGSTAIGDGAQAKSTYMISLGYQAGNNSTGNTNSNFIGINAGNQASGSTYSNFIGNAAGYMSQNHYQSNLIGYFAGYQSTASTSSNLIGYYAGQLSKNLTSVNLIGYQAGYQVDNASYSNFIGHQSGYGANNATQSNFIGYGAGSSATNAQYSNFIGRLAGQNATSASTSTFIGYEAGRMFVGNNVGANNIIIGTNISLPNATTNSLNIGGLLFGTGLNSSLVGDPSIVPSNGKIGINVVSPSEALHVSGNIKTDGTLKVTGTTFLGNGTFTKAGYSTGDILLDNGGNDTPGLLMYYANNSNYGIDSWNGSFDVLSGQLVRITNKLNESGGAVKMAIDTSGNMVVTGFVKANAWRAGQVINDISLSNTEVTISTTTVATSNSDTDFLTYSYTPLSSNSYIVIHYHLASFSFEGGTGNDSYFSRIKVDGNEITYSRQSTVNGNRTGVLFPLTGRYTNSSTTAKSIVVACRRDSADDSITIVNSATSMWLRITEIGR